MGFTAHTSLSQTRVLFFQVNFGKDPMEMRLPVRCPIKRDFLSGIQVEFKQSPHQRSLRARLYWLQVTLSSYSVDISNQFGNLGSKFFFFFNKILSCIIVGIFLFVYTFILLPHIPVDSPSKAK